MKNLALSLLILAPTALFAMEGSPYEGLTLREALNKGLNLAERVKIENKTGVKKLSLRRLGLTSIEGLPVVEGVEGIDLGRNRLTEIPGELFRNYPGLVYLNFNRNKLTTLPEEIGMLTKLQVLAASNNSIKSLPAGMKTLKSLTYLNLAHNGFDRFQKDIFVALQPTLKKAKLNDAQLAAEDKEEAKQLLGKALKI